MSRFLQPRYQLLEAYVPGEQPQDKVYIKLNTNESPYPPSPAVLAAVNAEEAALLRLYSDPECTALRAGLAREYGVRPENIFVTNGSDDALNFAFMAFAGADTPAVFPDITYGFYPVFARLHGIPYREQPLTADFAIDPADYCSADGLVVLANPNAPTGRVLPRDVLEEIIRTNPGHVVVIDEAYIDFGGESCVPLIEKYDNLLVVQTYSKSRSMAGARLGFAIGSPGLIEDLTRLKYSTNPYSLNRLTLAAGAAALTEAEYYREKCRQICETRAETTRRLRTLGFEVLDSCANFVFARHPAVDGEALYRALKERGILVRHFSAPRIRAFNRITIGTPEQMDALLRAVTALIPNTDDGKEPTR